MSRSQTPRKAATPHPHSTGSLAASEAAPTSALRRCALALALAASTIAAAAGAAEPTAARSASPKIGNVDTLERIYERWAVERISTGVDPRLVIGLTPNVGLTGAPTGTDSPAGSRGRGVVTLDLANGSFEWELSGLAGETEYALWAVDNRPGAARSAALDPTDLRLRLGATKTDLGGRGTLSAPLPRARSGFRFDRLVVAPAEARPTRGDLVLQGAPSLFDRLFFDDYGAESAYARLVPKAGSTPGASRRELLTRLVSEGERLFVEETFAGNGRTCASCHPPQNNFTLDPDFIATLPASDPLFVHENNADLAQLENAVLLRDFALILANADGFEDPTNKFVMRGVPHTLALGQSIFNGSPDIPLQNLGWSGDGAPNSGTLRDFAVGAVQQHATQRLDRIEGTDFRLPTETELDELEAFQLSLGRPADLETLTMTLVDPDAEAGRVLFNTTDSEGGSKQASKCILCHGQAGALSLPTGRNQNFNVGVEDEPHPADATGEPRPRDGGFGTEFDPDTGGYGDGRFSTPPLVEAADTAPFFHNNVETSLDDAIFFYQSDAFQQSPAGAELLARDSGGAPLAIETFKLGSYLRVLNTLENVRSVLSFGERALLEPVLEDAAALLDLGLLDLDDARTVLDEGFLHADIIATLDSAEVTLESARTTADAATRNALIESALVELRSTQPRMVVPRTRIAGLSDGDTVSGSVALATEVLDVAMRGVRITIDGTTLCTDLSAPFSCDWDTTLLPNGSYAVESIALDYAGGRTEEALTLTVAN